MGMTPGADHGTGTCETAFNLLFHRMPTPAMLVDESSDRVREINAAFEATLGWPRENVQGQPDAQFPLWIQPRHRQQLLDQLSQRAQPISLEGSVRRRDGALLRCTISVEFVVYQGTRCRLYLFDCSRQNPEQSQQPALKLPASAQMTSSIKAAAGSFNAVLRQSQDSLSLALDAAQMGIWDLELSTGLLNTSPRTASLHGLPAKAWKGRIGQFMTDVPTADRRAMRKAWVAIFRGHQQRYRMTYRVSPPGASSKWLEVTATLHRDHHDKPLRIVGTLLDITERRRNEQALIDSESKFAKLFQGSPEPCSLINLDNEAIIEVNRSFVKTFGYPKEDVIGHSIIELGLWKWGAQQDAILNALHSGEALRGLQIGLRGSNGRAHVCEMSSSFFTINRQRCVLLSFRDISARKLAEAALRASENKFALAFKASPDAMSISERESGEHLEINEGFTRLTGFSAAEVIGKTADDLDMWADAEEFLQLTQEFEVYGRVQQREMRIRNKYDQIRIVSASVEPLELNDAACILMTARDITEQKRIEAQVKHLAYHDALTNLPNRLLLTDRLKQNIALYERHQLRGALLFFDLDHFKHINDSLGHSSGDAVLQEVTRRLLMVVRQEDTVARLGGDEFVVLISGLEGDQQACIGHVNVTAEKLLNTLSMPMEIEGHSLQLSTSIGVSLIPDHGDNPDDLLKRADIALYKVKESGRNGVAFFEQAMQAVASQRLAVESELRLALSRSEFVLYYQPQFNTLTQKVEGSEALIRWDHPRKGLIGPGGFIDVLEESGMIVEVGTWVLEEACRFVSRLINGGQIDLDSFSVSVNISPRQFRQPGFVQQVRDSILPLGVPPGCIKLEITENIVIQNIADTVAKMHELRELGVRFAIDDFGTGYSSLSYLKRLPLDMLKIDQSFVHDCTEDTNDAEIIRAIIGIAKSLKLEIIAEGVETADQLAFLEQLACHCYQGYLFSPPIAEVDFVALLQHPRSGTGER